ncbi:unnamed protein product [Trifolium pratense]|uniref:Uncharacterized protein n=1 Tax=Trifolium pratense TaxID=57577 RepID=A0ACB0LD92_TRIPR|nr:unnamed protein product [Trifolium pratense]
MSASNRSVNNNMATSHAFSVKFRGNDELFCVDLSNNLTTIQALKRQIEVMYRFKYGRQIKIEKIAYYESTIDLASDNVGGYDEQPRKYEWKELKNDDDVNDMFNGVEVDPKYPRLYATLLVTN